MSFTGNLGVTHGGIFIAHSHGIMVPIPSPHTSQTINHTPHPLCSALVGKLHADFLSALIIIAIATSLPSVLDLLVCRETGAVQKLIT
jgi:hypothetical protein